MQPVSLAIVGLGRWGKVLVDSVQGRSAQVRFTAAVGRDASRIAADAAQRGMVVLPDLAAALADPSLDGVVLATPHSSHAAQIAACVAAGKPVLVEKPFTLTRATAEAALLAGREAGVLIAAAHNRRFLPSVAALRRIISEGELGTILHVETNFSGNVTGRFQSNSWRLAPGESPAGGLAGSGIHHIDAIIHLAGPISEVFALTSRRVHEIAMDDTTAVMFRLASGATASLLTMTATASLFRIQVFGTLGRAEIDGAETLVVTRLDGSQSRFQSEKFDIERAELEAFAAAIRGETPYPITDAEVLNGVAAFEAVSISADRNTPVSLSSNIVLG
jgi:predicted dehydrogenase